MKKEDSFLKKIYTTILDLIYPEEGICFICDKHYSNLDETHICPSCMEEFKFIDGKKCLKCGKPLEKEYISCKCSDCKRHPHYFSKVVSVLHYEGIIKDAIYKYKYGKKTYMYRSFGPLLIKGLKDFEVSIEDIDFVVPVPLHKSKYIKRGFNQAELLAKYIADKENITLSINNLIRIKKTSTQNKLHKLDRLRNMKDAFKIKSERIYKEKNILLVDDIFTTGSTADQCSKVFLEAGAKNIFVICIATGSDM